MIFVLQVLLDYFWSTPLLVIQVTSSKKKKKQWSKITALAWTYSYKPLCLSSCLLIKSKNDGCFHCCYCLYSRRILGGKKQEKEFSLILWLDKIHWWAKNWILVENNLVLVCSKMFLILIQYFICAFSFISLILVC